MPTYDYECKACGHAFEELQSFSEPPLTKCPACKKKKLERLFGGREAETGGRTCRAVRRARQRRLRRGLR